MKHQKEITPLTYFAIAGIWILLILLNAIDVQITLNYQ